MEPRAQWASVWGEGEASWLPRRRRWALALMALGALAALRLPALGAVAFLIGYVVTAAESLPLGVAIYILAAPFPLGVVIHHHHFFISDLMAIAIAAMLVFERRRAGIRQIVEDLLERAWRAPLLLLFALSVLSLAVALSHSGTVIKILEYAEFFVVMVAAVRWTATRPQIWTLYLVALGAAVAVVALWGLVQFLFALGPESNQIALHHVRATGFFGQPNPFGAYAGETFPLLLGLSALGPESVRRHWAPYAGMALAALGAVESYSRGAWVGDAAAVAVMAALAYWVGGGRMARRLLLLGVGIPAVLFAVVVLLGKTDFTHQRFHEIWVHATAAERLTSAVSTAFHPQQSYDAQQRLLIWRTAIEAIRSHPILGVGLGNFHLFIQAHPPKGLAGGIPPTAHDLYLEWGADLGLGGIVAALWLEWRWIKGAVRAVGRRGAQLDPFWQAAALGAVGTVVAFVVHNTVDFLIDHGVVIPLVMALGLIAGRLSARRTVRGERRG